MAVLSEPVGRLTVMRLLARSRSGWIAMLLADVHLGHLSIDCNEKFIVDLIALLTRLPRIFASFRPAVFGRSQLLTSSRLDDSRDFTSWLCPVGSVYQRGWLLRLPALLQLLHHRRHMLVHTSLPIPNIILLLPQGVPIGPASAMPASHRLEQESGICTDPKRISPRQQPRIFLALFHP
jgi:hypothetical protein